MKVIIWKLRLWRLKQYWQWQFQVRALESEGAPRYLIRATGIKETLSEQAYLARLHFRIDGALMLVMHTCYFCQCHTCSWHRYLRWSVSRLKGHIVLWLTIGDTLLMEVWLSGWVTITAVHMRSDRTTPPNFANWAVSLDPHLHILVRSKKCLINDWWAWIGRLASVVI